MDASRHRKGGLTAGVMFVCGLLLAAVAACTAGSDSGSGSAGHREDTGQAAVPRAQASTLQSDYEQVIKEVLPSVVQIQSNGGLGSGVVYDDKGNIVTNAHVVGSERAFKVTTATSEEPLTARLVAAYPQQDLAVVRLERVPKGLRPARFADSSKVQVGQIVLAMGSPLGLSSSVTQGIVSATGRTVSEPGEEGGVGATIANMIQTSAAINPGNSGGALVDLNREVIGIPTLAATDPQMNGTAPGIGFAIPSNMVRTVADQIIEHGKVTNSGRAALNITARTILGADQQPAGAGIVEVTDGGAADKAGLRPGDVITRVGDKDVTGVTSLAEALAALQPGARTTVAYTRNGQHRTAEVTLGEQ